MKEFRWRSEWGLTWAGERATSWLWRRYGYCQPGDRPICLEDKVSAPILNGGERNQIRSIGSKKVYPGAHQIIMKCVLYR